MDRSLRISLLLNPFTLTMVFTIYSVIMKHIIVFRIHTSERRPRTKINKRRQLQMTHRWYTTYITRSMSLVFLYTGLKFIIKPSTWLSRTLYKRHLSFPFLFWFQLRIQIPNSSTHLNDSIVSDSHFPKSDLSYFC